MNIDHGSSTLTKNNRTTTPHYSNPICWHSVWVWRESEDNKLFRKLSYLTARATSVWLRNWQQGCNAHSMCSWSCKWWSSHCINGADFSTNREKARRYCRYWYRFAGDTNIPILFSYLHSWADGDTKQHLRFEHGICGCDTLSAPCVKDKTVDVR